LHFIKSPDQRSLITSLKVIISLLSEAKSKSKSFMISSYADPLNSACGCIQMVVNIVVVTKNVCMSRRWKAELEANRVRKQLSPRFTLRMP
jgi:hypothetical protein